MQLVVYPHGWAQHRVRRDAQPPLGLLEMNVQQALVMEREVSVVALQTGCPFAGRRREQRRRLERHPCNQAARTQCLLRCHPHRQCQ